MKNFFGRIYAFLVAIFTIILYVVDEYFLHVFENIPEAKLIIILLGAIMTYNAFLATVLENSFLKVQEQVLAISKDLKKSIDIRLKVFQNTIPFSELAEVEKRHGIDNDEVSNEVWVIANKLQEAEQDDPLGNLFLETILLNIKKNNVIYYYMLPNKEEAKLQIRSLKNMLSMYSKDRYHDHSSSGCLKVYFVENLDYYIASEYFDIVLYFDCGPDGLPIYFGNKQGEGYYCFSDINQDNDYFYTEIKSDKVFQIRQRFGNLDWEIVFQ